MVNVAIYVRLSDEDKNKQCSTDESESIQNQKSMLADYCKERNWDIFDMYCDEDLSGADITRPDFNRMLSDCEKGKIDIVLCKSQSRFSRDLEIIEKYLHNKFQEWNVRFIGVVDHADTFDINNKKSRQINGLMNEWYLEDTSENIRKTLQHKRQSGEFTGSFAPYGYLIDPKNKNHLVVDEEAAVVVRQIFDWYLLGWGYRKIVIELNEMKIPCPTARKKVTSPSFYNTNRETKGLKIYYETLWTQSTIYRILRDEKYTGTLVQGKTHTVSYKNKKIIRLPPEEWIRVPNTHEAIINDETWKKTQARLQSRVRATKITKEVSVLSQKVKCDVCKTSMKRDVYYKDKKTKKKMSYQLTCGNYKVGAMTCPNARSINGELLESIIVEQFNKLIDSYCDFDKIKITDNLTEKINLLSETLNTVTKDISNKETKLTKVYEDKIDGLISQEQYSIFSDKFSQEIKKLKDNQNSLENQLLELGQRQNDTTRKINILHGYEHIDKLTRPIVEEFIDCVYIGQYKEGCEREIRIEWNV